MVGRNEVVLELIAADKWEFDFNKAIEFARKDDIPAMNEDRAGVPHRLACCTIRQTAV